MQALYFDGHSLALRTDYPTPAGREALVRVSLAGICGTDLELLRGYKGFHGVPGHEFVGVVTHAQTAALIGQRVVGELNVGCGHCASCRDHVPGHCNTRTALGIVGRDGAFAEYLALPESNLHCVPDSVSDTQAVFTEPLAAAFEILEQIRIAALDRVAILGDGRLAQLAARVLHAAGFAPQVIGRHPEKLRRLASLGISTVAGIDTALHGVFDIVVEATGRTGGIEDALRLVRPRGIVVLKSTSAEALRPDITPVIINEITLIGSRCGPFDRALAALVDRSIAVDDLIDGIYPLAQFDIAFARLREPGVIKILLRP